MNRRKLIVGAATSLCAATAVQAQETKKKPKRRPRAKITVLKRELYQDINDEYRDGKAKVCPLFKDGQEFDVLSPYQPPEGFCDWAWADIRPYIQTACAGSKRPQIGCCTDGVRPVVFKIEKAAT